MKGMVSFVFAIVLCDVISDIWFFLFSRFYHTNFFIVPNDASWPKFILNSLKIYPEQTIFGIVYMCEEHIFPCNARIKYSAEDSL